MTSTNGPLVHFAGSSIRFATGDSALLDTIHTHFKHCLGADGELIAEYEIAFDGEAAFTVSRDGGSLLSGVEAERVLGYLMQDGLTQLNGASRTHLVFHAAALALGPQGVLLFGKSGSGKSTLAAGLVAGGFHYLTDEVIAWPAEVQDQISGFCRSIALKHGSGFLWERWREQPVVKGLLRFKDGGAWIAPTLLRASAIRASVAPRLLVFPRYAANSPLQAEPLTSGEALFRLLQCLVNARNFADGGMGASARLARLAPAFRLIYSDLESAGKWIREQMQAR